MKIQWNFVFLFSLFAVRIFMCRLHAHDVGKTSKMLEGCMVEESLGTLL